MVSRSEKTLKDPLVQERTEAFCAVIRKDTENCLFVSLRLNSKSAGSQSDSTEDPIRPYQKREDLQEPSRKPLGRVQILDMQLQRRPQKKTQKE